MNNVKYWDLYYTAVDKQEKITSVDHNNNVVCAGFDKECGYFQKTYYGRVNRLTFRLCHDYCETCKEIGNSICEEDKLDLARELVEKAEAKGVKLLLQIDNVVGRVFAADTESMVVDYDSIPDDWEGFDIGPKTVEMYCNELQNAKTVLWNGPIGVFEFDQFAKGTNAIAECLANLTDCKTIIGGGDSAAAITKIGLADRMTHISTGGGASLEFIEGKALPGIECIPNKD